MKIKDLSPELRELAVKNYFDPECSAHAGKKWASRENALEKSIDEAFVWSYTPEGWHFWDHADRIGTAPENHPLHSKENNIE